MIALKTINYRGGIARFRVPQSWVEDYEPTGGGTFYEDRPGTGTLRINVMGFEKPATAGSGPQSARDLLVGLDCSGQVEELPSGAAVARSRRTAVEGNEELLIYTWQIGVLVPSTHFRMVVFTYTILAGQERESDIQQEVQLLDKLIAEGEYPAVRGIGGDDKHARTG